jgi:NIPSNAP
VASGLILSDMQIQLRDYRIRHGQMDAWIAGWKSRVVPLREEAGFRLIGAWVDAREDRFLWLLGYSGSDGFQAADDRYYASQERRELQPDPADLIEEASQTMVDAVL